MFLTFIAEEALGSFGSKGSAAAASVRGSGEEEEDNREKRGRGVEVCYKRRLRSCLVPL